MRRHYFPLPTRIFSNGETQPRPQSRDQKRLERKLVEVADRYRKPHKISRREFFKTASGMAAAFLAMNLVYGPLFSVEAAEAADPEYAGSRRKNLENQFIFDDQLHFVHDEFRFQGLLDLRKHAARNWNPDIKNDRLNFKSLQFRNFLEEVFLQSDTAVGLLSGAPSDVPENWFLSNQQIANTREMVNAVAGTHRMLAHFVVAPRQKGWMEAVDRGIEELRPDSWKGYTVGDPLSNSDYPYRLDDEKVMYPFYEKVVKAGINNFCIHKGLLPADYRQSFPNWRYGTVEDLPKAARDWPQINFIIYHAALQPLASYSEEYLARFEKTGRMDWVTDLAEMPAKYGLNNIHADLGTCFANCAVTHPRHAAALLGTLVQGLGVERVYWGTDAIWYGSPQWQIEAFRRMEIPEDLRERFGFAALGGPDSDVKNKILGKNAARLYGISPEKDMAAIDADRLSKLKQEYLAGGEGRRRKVRRVLYAAVRDMMAG